MKLFTSNRERNLWIWVLLVVIAIFSTLAFAPQLAFMLREKGLLIPAFWIAFALVVITILTHGLRKQPGKIEFASWLGIISVYFLMFIRFEIVEERGHLIEYGVLSIFIYEALTERVKQGEHVYRPALLSIFLTSVIGTFDELLQLFIPSRVFDFRDILFNCLAAVLAVTASLILRWVRHREKYA